MKKTKTLPQAVITLHVRLGDLANIVAHARKNGFSPDSDVELSAATFRGLLTTPEAAKLAKDAAHEAIHGPRKESRTR